MIAPRVRARLADETGSSLVLVLVFVMGFSVIITAVLGFSSTALTANKRANDVARQIEAADAGVELALERIRAGLASAVGGSASTETVNVNNDAVGASLAQRDLGAICIDGPFGAAAPVAPSTTSVATFKVGTAATCPAANTLPYGATWSIAAGNGGTIDATTGKLEGTPGATYTLRARVGNVSATRIVTLP